MLDGNPPSSIDSERGFLGACLVGGWIPYEEASDHGLAPEDFYKKEHGVIYAALNRLYESKRPFDFITVKEAIEKSGRWPTDFGLATYLTDLAADCPTYVNGPAYAKVIKEKALRRSLLDAAAQIATIAYTEADDIETTYDKADAALKRTKDKAPLRGRDPSPEDILARLEGMKAAGVPTRWPYINSISTGMVRGHLWVIGGFSSTGKSAVMVNLLEDAVVKSNGAAMVASTEMSQEQYLLRALSLTSGVPQRTIRHGGMTVTQMSEYQRARDIWKSSRVRIFDDLYNVTRIRRQARRVKEQLGGLDVVFVDFLQNLNETGDEVKDARTSAIQLQQLAKDLDVCVVALSQISNAQAMRQDESGAMGNYYAFKGSGAIKDAADLAVMLDRDRVNAPDVMWFNIVKNRHDAIGRFAARMNLDTGMMTQMTLDEQQMADPNSGRRSKQKKDDDGS